MINLQVHIWIIYFKIIYNQYVIKHGTNQHRGLFNHHDYQEILVWGARNCQTAINLMGIEKKTMVLDLELEFETDS